MTSASGTTSARTWAMMSGISRRMRGLGWDDRPTVLERDVGLLDDRLAAVQPGLDIYRGAEIAADGDRLNVKLVVRADQDDLRAVGVEDQRGRRDVPAFPGWADLEPHVHELPR